jgi:hypothetical protein
MGNSSSGESNNGRFAEEPDDIFEPRTSAKVEEVENLSARTRALLSLSDTNASGINDIECSDDSLRDIYGGDLGVSPVNYSFMQRATSNIVDINKNDALENNNSQISKPEDNRNPTANINVEKDQNQREHPEAANFTETLSQPVKEIAWLIVNQEKFVTGHVTVTSQLLMFEPHNDDEFVKKDGLLTYQFCIDVRDITGCGEVGHVTRVINTKQVDERTGKEKRARKGGGMTYFQIFWQKQKDRNRSRRRNTNQTLFLVRKDKVSSLVNTLRLFLDKVAIDLETLKKKKNPGKIETHLTTGPIISHTRHLSPTKLFKMATNARGGSPSPPPTIRIENSIGSKSISSHSSNIGESKTSYKDSNLKERGSENGSFDSNDKTNDNSNNNIAKKKIGSRVKGRSLHTPLLIGGKSNILKTADCLDIESVLPHGQRGYNWQLSYSSSIHGLNWITFHRCIELAGSNLLIIRTTKGEVIGCYASEQWVPTGTYTGTGECFVFKCKPGPFRTFTWSFGDPYFMMCTATSLVMGGGGGFAIRLDNHFKGYSTSCETFNTSGPLTKSENFEVFDIEVYCFVSGNTVDESKRPLNFDWSRHS